MASCNQRNMPSIGPVLGQRLRRWPNTEPSLVHVSLTTRTPLPAGRGVIGGQTKIKVE